MLPIAISKPYVRISGSMLAALARAALVAEAELTPKPGLVDRRSCGSHEDLTLDLMRASAFAIEPYIEQMAMISFSTVPSQLMREQLAAIGRAAEQAMLRASGGCNSHKGAIWMLGLLVSATAMQGAQGMEVCDITQTAADLAGFEDKGAPKLMTHGEAIRKKYGYPGARGEAVQRFPNVRAGLAMLRARRNAGCPENEARIDTLLDTITRLGDTCLVHRGGLEGLQLAKDGARSVLRRGGVATPAGREAFERFEQAMVLHRLSPGGSADVLSAVLFLDSLVEEGRAHGEAGI